MARKAKKPGRLTNIAASIPWWASCLLAITSYVALHTIATTYQPTPTAQLDGLHQKAVPAPLMLTLATIGQHLLPLSLLFAAAASAMQSNVRRKNQRQLQEFKGKLAKYYQRAGYEIIPPPENRYNSIDLALNKGGKTYFVQCSHWSRHEIDVQQLRTFNAAIRALDAKGGYFVTRGEYTEAAWEYAEDRNIKLINGHRLKRMLPATHENPKTAAEPPEAEVEIVDHPDAWYNTIPSRAKSATPKSEIHDNAPKPEAKGPHQKKLLIPAVAISMLLAIGLIHYITGEKPQDAPQPPSRPEIKEMRTPLRQQKTPPKQAAQKKTATDPLQKDIGYQKTIQWWQQTNQGIEKFNDWIKASYAQVEQQTRRPGQKEGLTTGSQATADAFRQFLRSYYPGSTYDKGCSCGSIKVTPTNTLEFHDRSGAQSFRWADQKTTRKATFRNREGTRYSAYEVSDGTNSITLLIDTDNPKKSRFIKASMPDIAANAKKMAERRRASPYNTSHPTSPTHPKPGPTATMLNDVYPAYIAKDNMGMNEYADQLVTDPKARQRLLKNASKLYN